MRTHITHSPEESESIGFDLAEKLNVPAVFALHGSLGSGKTVFTKGFARGLGIREVVQSPTFILMNVFPIAHGSLKHFVHIDCYRIENSGEIRDIGFEDFINNGTSVLVIEWADKINDLLPKETIHIYFDVIDEFSRRVSVSG